MVAAKILMRAQRGERLEVWRFGSWGFQLLIIGLDMGEDKRLGVKSEKL